MMSSESEEKKIILIIKSNPQVLGSVEQFLRNREWTVISATEIKEALSLIVKHQPAFVMISMDHPNNKMRALPKLIRQAFPTCVMAYVEKSTTENYKILADCACDHKINPPVTGPGVERAINKYLKEQQQQAQEQRNNAASLSRSSKLNSNSNDATVISSRGLDGKNDGVISVSGSKENPSFHADQASKLLKQLAEDGDGINAPGTDQEISVVNPSIGPKNLENYLDKGKLSDMHSETQQGNGFGSVMSLGQLPNKDNPIDPSGNEKKAENGSRVLPQYAREGNSTNTEYSQNSPAHTTSANAGTNAKPQSASASSTVSTPQNNLTATSEKKSTPLPVAREIDEDEGRTPENESAKTDVSVKTPESKPTYKEEYHIIDQATTKAIEESVQRGDGKVKEKLKDTSKVVCIVINSQRFSGYLIAAMGQNRPLDEKFAQMIKDKLFKFLKESGEDIPDQDSINIQIKPVAFEEWSLECANFLRKSIHNGQEMAMAFFPFNEAQTKVGESASVDMGSVKITDLAGDLQVEFNLYMYMPANKKYVLYTPKGSKFYVNQKDRLGAMKVTHMHIRRSETQGLSQYRAQNYLNQKIREYEEKKRKLGSAA